MSWLFCVYSRPLGLSEQNEAKIFEWPFLFLFLPALPVQTQILEGDEYSSLLIMYVHPKIIYSIASSVIFTQIVSKWTFFFHFLLPPPVFCFLEFSSPIWGDLIQSLQLPQISLCIHYLIPSPSEKHLGHFQFVNQNNAAVEILVHISMHIRVFL